ncbi:hypothetical protein Glove_228g124 [Diversispora epigaea]|uniref:TLDc domain-containing protein n=1 Tax=Diversispora epigaea TaxID=1348612 RepID=A0A397IDF4_9GLOM|nr:hypothetical protein Glove_228g124 [Diversispora epigaea]
MSSNGEFLKILLSLQILKKDFLTLRTTLQQCLPLIRYLHILNTELFDKILSYKKHLIAPDRPVKSISLSARSAAITEFPSRAEVSKEPFATIISEEHVAEISSWIDYGFIPQTFWNICHGHAKTVVVVKVKGTGTNEIIGGHTPLAWDNTFDNF